MSNFASRLNPQEALVFRILHRKNFQWVLDHGLYAGNADKRFSAWVSIGHRDLIQKRSQYPVPISPGGCLGDYVPFYFTPFSPMLLNVLSGKNGVMKHEPRDIVILVSNLHDMCKRNIQFVFTDAHAIARYADFYWELGDLDKIDWSILQTRDFKRDDNDLNKFERYQAEALVYQFCPIDAIQGVICYDKETTDELKQMVDDAGKTLKIVERPNWYFK